MKILFGTKFYGQDTSEVPSGFLIWIIEEFEQADWSLINAAKQELSARLKLSWEPPTDQEVALEKKVKALEFQLAKVTHEKDLFHSVIGMAPFCKGNIYTLLGYMNNPGYMYSVIKQIRDANALTS